MTPISFFDHIVRRLGLKTNLHWEFLNKCELLLLSVIAGKTFAKATSYFYLITSFWNVESGRKSN